MENSEVERQKLVCDEDDCELTLTATSQQTKTPISELQNIYSGSESTQSFGKPINDAKLNYVNERKSLDDSARKFDFKAKKKLLKEEPQSSNLIDLKREVDDSSTETLENNKDPIDPVTSTPFNPKASIPNHLQLPTTSSYPQLTKIASQTFSNSKSSLNNFASRPLKHHTFLSEVDVRDMEKNLIGLLDEFHSGKLRAFSGTSMNQMKKIREQQEKLNKLHFDLGLTSSMSSDTKSDNMHQLVQRLNEISHSIDKLNH
ncbi:unnamed protein product [Diamesa hyperborea]